MKTLCNSVRLDSFYPISDKCYKAVAFDGSEALIPKSQYFGQDYDVQKSEAHWISDWILSKSKLQYSVKKQAWFDKETCKMLPTYKVEKHEPKKLEPVNNNTIKRLKKMKPFVLTFENGVSITVLDKTVEEIASRSAIYGKLVDGVFQSCKDMVYTTRPATAEEIKEKKLHIQKVDKEYREVCEYNARVSRYNSALLRATNEHEFHNAARHLR